MPSPAQNHAQLSEEKQDHVQNMSLPMHPQMMGMNMMQGPYPANQFSPMQGMATMANVSPMPGMSTMANVSPMPGMSTMANVSPMPRVRTVNPNKMTTYGTAINNELPSEEELYYAKAQGDHIFKQYHPNGGKITNDQTRAHLLSVPNNWSKDTLPKSADLTKTVEGDPGVMTHFPDALTAEFYRAAIRRQDPPKHTDPTIPTRSIAIKAHVVALIHAFNSYSEADDNPGMLKPFQNQSRDQKLVECMCWGILKACMDRSVIDVPLMQAWDEVKAKHDSREFVPFAVRFDAILNAMTKSKTICKHLFDAPYSQVFVDDPYRALTRVKANRDLNKQKADQMSAGKRIRDEEAKANGTWSPKRIKTPARRGVRASADPVTPTGAPVTPTGPPITPTYSHLDSPYPSEASPLEVPPNTPYSDPAQSPTVRRSARQTRRPLNYAPPALIDDALLTPAESPTQPTVEDDDQAEVQTDNQAQGLHLFPNNIFKTEGNRMMSSTPSQGMYGLNNAWMYPQMNTSFNNQRFSTNFGRMVNNSSFNRPSNQSMMSPPNTTSFPSFPHQWPAQNSHSAMQNNTSPLQNNTSALENGNNPTLYPGYDAAGVQRELEGNAGFGGIGERFQEVHEESDDENGSHGANAGASSK